MSDRRPAKILLARKTTLNRILQIDPFLLMPHLHQIHSRAAYTYHFTSSRLYTYAPYAILVHAAVLSLDLFTSFLWSLYLFACTLYTVVLTSLIYHFQGYTWEMAWLSISLELLDMKLGQEHSWTSFCLAPLHRRWMALPARNAVTLSSLRES